MLVLSRKPGEKILIGDDVEITIIRISPNAVRIGIEAPRSMNIAREELLDNALHLEVHAIENEGHEPDIKETDKQWPTY